MNPRENDSSLSGRRFVVVGATGGIGKEIVQQLALAGAVIHATGRNRQLLAEISEWVACKTHVLDLFDEDGAKRLFDQIGSTYGLIVASGVGGSLAPFEKTPVHHIDSTIATNVTATLKLVHAVLPGMIAQRCGHLVIIGSIAGVYPVPSPTYAASKAASHHFLRSLSVGLAGSGVRLSEILPGRVDTDLIARANAHRGEGHDSDCGNLLHPRDVADAVMFALTRPPGVHVAQIELWPSSQALAGPRSLTPSIDSAADRAATHLNCGG